VKLLSRLSLRYVSATIPSHPTFTSRHGDSGQHGNPSASPSPWCYSCIKFGVLMSLSTDNLSVLTPRAGALLVGAPVVLLLLRCIFRIFLHPLSHIPGPFLAKVTSLWLHYHAYIGDEASAIHRLHAKYGPYVRVSPNEVDISDVDAIQPLYVSKSGFPKAKCYANFDIDGHNTIFSTTDHEYRAVRARSVVPLFSMKALRENGSAIWGCVDRMVERLEVENKRGKPVNVLNLTRSLAVDAVSIEEGRAEVFEVAEVDLKFCVRVFGGSTVLLARVCRPKSTPVSTDLAQVRTFHRPASVVALQVQVMYCCRYDAANIVNLLYGGFEQPDGVRSVADCIEVICRMWEHRADMKEAEGCCIERARESDYNYTQPDE
jgi:hypothetical protein